MVVKDEESIDVYYYVDVIDDMLIWLNLVGVWVWRGIIKIASKFNQYNNFG